MRQATHTETRVASLVWHDCDEGQDKNDGHTCSHWSTWNHAKILAKKNKELKIRGRIERIQITLKI